MKLYDRLGFRTKVTLHAMLTAGAFGWLWPA